MPYKDGTGPMGGGQQGRGMGHCGHGGRGGGGRGRRGIFQAPVESVGDDTQSLEARVAELERRLKDGKNEGK